MKFLKCTLSALVLVFITSASAFSQYNVVKVDALGYIRDRLFIGYERTFFKKTSIGIAYENNKYDSEGSEYVLKTRGFIPELRYYPYHKRRTAPLGFFVGTAFRFSTVSEAYAPKDVEIRGNVFNYGLITGYKVRYKMLISELLLGYGGGMIEDSFLAANRSSFQNISDPENFDEIKSNLRLALSVGIVFPRITSKTSGRY